MPSPKVKLKLDGIANTFALLNTFKRLAKAAGWSKEDIRKVVQEAVSENDYEHMISVLSSHCDQSG